MSVTYSNELSLLLAAKIETGLLKHARKLAFWHECIHTNRSRWDGKKDYGTQLLTRVHDKFYLPDFTTAAVQKSTRRWWVFVFDCDEREAITKIHAECKKGAVPHKVKVRMVVDRLDKLEKRLDTTMPTFDRQILTPSGFNAYLEKIWAITHWNRGQIPYFLDGINEVLNREDFNQGTFDEAWDTWKVKKVMVA